MSLVDCVRRSRGQMSPHDLHRPRRRFVLSAIPRFTTRSAERLNHPGRPERLVPGSVKGHCMQPITPAANGGPDGLALVGLATFARQPACPDWDSSTRRFAVIPFDPASSYRVGNAIRTAGNAARFLFHGFGRRACSISEDWVHVSDGRGNEDCRAGDSDVISADKSADMASALVWIEPSHDGEPAGQAHCRCQSFRIDAGERDGRGAASVACTCSMPCLTIAVSSTAI